ncbi:MAG: acetolactate synthase [Phycisphaerae bacterium]|nr:acetolactate synthase [Phycisphaerae bacterium]
MTEGTSPLGTCRGYTNPTVTQFSVFLENRVGRLLDLVKVLDDSPARICALSVHEASDHAVVRVITSDAADARALLKRQQLAFMETDLLVVAMDKGHTLSSMCQHLLRAELSIRFAYPLMPGVSGVPMIALAVDDPTLASQILIRKEFRLLGEAELLG